MLSGKRWRGERPRTTPSFSSPPEIRLLNQSIVDMEQTMECHKCGTPIPAGEERSYHDTILCEDCYMDVLSPARACDPWAVRSAGLSARSGDSLEGSAVQQRILSLIQKNNGMSIADLAERLAVKTGDV
ncbi:MAG TPA: winged helix-turn-helix domain-containing protein, partial [Desulfobacteraceae bacterium]|nr:winged helix-turn-helix domain-containing protein [Desulfobacteraceae bacterium]